MKVIDYGSKYVGCEGRTARWAPSWLQGEEPMGLRADEPHPHGLYSTNGQGDGWADKRLYEVDWKLEGGSC